MKHSAGLPLLTLATMAATALSSLAGAKIPINDEAYIDLGLRLQLEYIRSEKDLDGDGQWEPYDDFKIRRARLRVKGVFNKELGAFLQTESATGAGMGLDMRVIDVYAYYKPVPQANLFFGQHLVPASRQTATSAGALMTIDRTGSAYKNIAWGTRSTTAFATRTQPDTNTGLRSEVAVRDTGATFFGNQPLAEELHLKYYLGIYEGIKESTSDRERLTGRLQVNLWDPETSYFYQATYLGKIKTLALGASYDLQDQVARDTGGMPVDYRFYSLDLFSEYPIGPGSLSFEAAYQGLDLSDASSVDLDGNPDTAPSDWTRSQGSGYYVQAGYYIHQWQPWAGYDAWRSDASDGKGSYDQVRVGLSYFIKGHNANIKAGYEHLQADAPIGSSLEDTIDSFVMSLHMTY